MMKVINNFPAQTRDIPNGIILKARGGDRKSKSPSDDFDPLTREVSVDVAAEVHRAGPAIDRAVSRRDLDSTGIEEALRWSREEGAREAERAAFRRPHPQYGALGVVLPSFDEERAAQRAEAYMRSLPGTRLPPLKFVWVKDLEYLNGGAPRVRTPRPVPIILKTGRGFEATFPTVVHELQHVRDAWSGGYSEDQMETRAEAAAERAQRERWRW